MIIPIRAILWVKGQIGQIGQIGQSPGVSRIYFGDLNHHGFSADTSWIDGGKPSISYDQGSTFP